MASSLMSVVLGGDEDDDDEPFESYDLYPSHEKLTEALVLAKTRSSSLDNIRKLNCWGSEVKDISILKKMPNLEVCSLSVNHIDCLEPFSHCPRLQELYIRKNDVSDLTEICHLKNLSELRILWLADNPCASADLYRQTVLRTLPNLQKLDNVAVTEEEVTHAATEGLELCLKDPDTEKKEEGNSSPESEPLDPLTLTLFEINKIREESGLKPLPIDKVISPKVLPSPGTDAKNAAVLEAVLLLVPTLDRESLLTVQNAVQQELEES